MARVGDLLFRRTDTVTVFRRKKVKRESEEIVRSVGSNVLESVSLSGEFYAS